MTKYHDPKQQKTVEARNMAEAEELLKEKTETKATKPTVTEPTVPTTVKETK